MSEATAAPATSPKVAKAAAKPKVAKPKAKATHPTYTAMIVNALRALKELNGSSRQAILKYIVKQYNLDANLAKVRARLALKAALKSGMLKHGKSKHQFLYSHFYIV